MKSPLFINRYYMSAHSPVGECLRAFVSALPEEEWQPFIYGSDKKPLLGSVPENVSLVHEDDWVQYLAAIVRRIFIPDLTWLPGYEWYSWGKRTAKTIINDIHNGSVKPDYIHSICFPIASHWAALKIKEATGLPWVMQFYDPWADNPYRLFKTKYLKKKDWTMERFAVEKADLIIHDNEVIANLWRERYGDEIGKKIVVLPLTVPMPKTKPSSPCRNTSKPLVISHIGNFLMNRRAEPFVKAVAELISLYPELRGRFVVNFIGMVMAEDKALISKYELDDIFKLHGTLPIEKCEKYYMDSDMFLAIDGINPDNVFFPSKILKYLYFNRPILGITPHGSVLDYELKASRHVVFANDDTNSIVEFLHRAITDYASIINYDAEYWHRFEPSSVIEEYQRIIKCII